MKKIKVGIVGCGGIAGGKHLPGHNSVRTYAMCLKVPLIRGI